MIFCRLTNLKVSIHSAEQQKSAEISFVSVMNLKISIHSAEQQKSAEISFVSVTTPHNRSTITFNSNRRMQGWQWNLDTRCMDDSVHVRQVIQDYTQVTFLIPIHILYISLLLFSVRNVMA